MLLVQNPVAGTTSLSIGFSPAIATTVTNVIAPTMAAQVCPLDITFDCSHRNCRNKHFPKHFVVQTEFRSRGRRGARVGLDPVRSCPHLFFYSFIRDTHELPFGAQHFVFGLPVSFVVSFFVVAAFLLSICFLSAECVANPF